MSSGVTVSNEAKTVYEEVKKDKKYRYIIYHIKDEKVIDVESTGPRNATYSEFLEELTKVTRTSAGTAFYDFPRRLCEQRAPRKAACSVDRLIPL
uniref:Putative actin depolymerizing factor n=1 Tax=Ixodes ricinus TaxID=34613 RepID=V5HY37_IXORI